MSESNKPKKQAFVVLPVILLAYVALLGTVASCWGTRWWWLLDVASNLRMQALWCLLIFSGCLCLLRQRLHALVLGLAALALAGTLVPFYWPQPKATNDPHHLRLLALNVLSGNRDFAEVTELIQTEAPDVVIALEVTAAWDRALGELKCVLPHAYRAPREDNFGIAIYSRLPLNECQCIELADSGIEAVEATLTVRNQEVRLFGVHTLPPISRGLARARNLQLQYVARLAAANEGPTIVAGDLNTTSWSPYFQDLLRDGNLLDTRLGNGVLPSHRALPLMQMTLDHILVSPDVSVQRRWVVPCRGSDHDAVVADLVL